MMTRPPTSRRLGWALVGIQGLLFAAIAFWPASLSTVVKPLVWPAAALVALGSAGMVASAMHLGRALTPLPEPNRTGMVARGVYRWARHPMYTSLIVICAGVALGRGVVAVWGWVIALAVFFQVKSRLEERYLIDVYDGYADYAARTGRFVPGLGKRDISHPPRG